jgi:hypothetical protein
MIPAERTVQDGDLEGGVSEYHYFQGRSVAGPGTG